MKDFPEENVAFQGVVGPLRLDDVLLAAKKANRVAPLQVVRGDAIVGIDQLRSAAMHAQRAMDEGRNHAERLEVEFVRYAAARRQIRKALDIVGVTDGAASAVICAFGPKRLDAVPYFVDFLGLVTDDSILDGTPAALEKLGITEAQKAATPAHLHTDLALEAVASVDLMRK